MTALAGELADGLVPHPTNSSGRYIREVMLETTKRGAARVGRSPDELEIIANPLTAIGSSTEAVAAQRELHRRALATLFSTPNYWPSLELFGWGGVGIRLK